MSDPLLPHLLDIVSDPAAEGLILAGGFGMRIKQNYLNETQARTLIAEVPTARATQDLDFFLRMELFLQPERGRNIRTLLDGLAYTEHTPKWQFGKPYDAASPDRQVMVDLLARRPGPDEPIRSDDRRVGGKSGTDLHGRTTAEAFAIEEQPQAIPVSGTKSNGTVVDARVHVPHPYAFLQMKIKAAHEWHERKQKGEHKPYSEKHVFDVYILVAMLTEQELIECSTLAAKYEDHPIARDNRLHSEVLFETADAPGFLEVARQGGAAVRSNHAVFVEALYGAVGVTT